MKTLLLHRLCNPAAIAAACFLSLPFSLRAQDGSSDATEKTAGHRVEYANNSILSIIESFAGNILQRKPVQHREDEYREEYRREDRRDNYEENYYRGNSTAANVQQALASRGYYRGRIDGAIGPQSRNAIARYQRDRGMPVTGNINSYLLRDLGFR